MSCRNYIKIERGRSGTIARDYLKSQFPERTARDIFLGDKKKLPLVMKYRSFILSLLSVVKRIIESQGLDITLFHMLKLYTTEIISLSTFQL